MNFYGVIPDSVYKDAGDVLAYVGGTKEYPDIGLEPGFDLAVAAAGVALERGAPSTFYESRPLQAESLFRAGSQEWRTMHNAVARVLDMQRQGHEMSNGTVVKHIVSDVVEQASARRTLNALKLGAPFEEGMSDAEKGRVQEAKSSKSAEGSLHHELIGAWHQLPEKVQENIFHSFSDGSRLSDRLKNEVAIASNAITEIWERQEAAEVSAQVRIDKSLDYDTPIFKEPTQEQVDRIDNLLAGKFSPSSGVESIILSHAIDNADMDGNTFAIPAYYRAQNEFAEMGSSAAILSYIEADRNISEKEKEEMEPGEKTMKAAGLYHLLSHSEQREVLMGISGGGGVSPLQEMRAEFTLGKPVEQDLLQGMSFEGLSKEDAAKFSLSGIHLPEERVRVNGRLAYSSDLVDEIGEYPLTIAKTVIVANEVPEGQMPSITPFYEFEGREGRYPASKFFHENGEEHVYGTVTEVDKRLFLVPLDMIAEDDKATLQGNVREISSFLKDGREKNSEDDMVFMRREARNGPVAGEFVFRPSEFGDKQGPVQLVAVPWMSGASPEEKKLSVQLAHEAAGKPLQANAAIAASMTQMSRQH